MTSAGAVRASHFVLPTRAVVSNADLPGAVVRTRSEIDALADAWLALESHGDGLTVFQSFGWVQAVFDFEAARQNADFNPVIVTLSDAGGLIALLPLERVKTGLRSVLVPLGHAFGQYSDILLADRADPKVAVAQLLRAATAAASCDVIGFLKVREGSALDRGLPKNRVETGKAQAAPYVALDAFPDFASYFRTIRSKTRKNIRNARNRLEREAPVEHAIYTKPADQLGVIERTLSGRSERLKELGLTSRAFSNTGFAQFCKSLVGRKDLALMALSLRHGTAPIAEQWGFVHKGRYYAFVASRDFSNSDESPGKMHLGEVIQAASARGLSGCDLGVPAMPYKLTWATVAITVRDYALPVTPKGALMIQLWDVWARPLVKRAMLSMPSGLRTRIIKLAGWRR